MFEKPTQQEQKPVEAEKEVQLEEVAELEAPIKKIIEKIRDRIESGEYKLVIGDDASGRIPALILGEFLKEIYKINGLSEPDTIFIPGKLKETELPTLLKKLLQQFLRLKSKESAILEEHLHKHRAEPGDKILIVTDTVYSGNSLKVLVGLLKELGYICDIATIGLEKPDYREAQELRDKNLGDTEIISGEYETDTPDYLPNTPKVWRNKEISGVKKTPGQTKSIPIRKKQELINQSREDAKVMAKRLVRWYEPK